MTTTKFKLRNYLLSLLFYEVLQHLKIFIQTNFRFERSIRFLVEKAIIWVTNVTRSFWDFAKHSLSQNKHFFTQVMNSRLEDRCFCWFSAAISVPLKGTPRCIGVFRRSFVHLVKRFPEYLSYVISHRPDFWRDFIVYFSSFIAQILGFLYRMVWKQKVSPQ